MEILKLVMSFLGGGAASAVLNEWLRRKNSKLQTIPLIERVNRLVDPGLDGFTLARAVKGSPDRLERVQNVREYQFTLRNTSPVHLKDIEIQFEFPADDMEAWAERPILSKTAPIATPASVTHPWTHGFRWRIPSFPSTDSLEFTFKAVSPPSDNYEVSLYNSDRVVIIKSKGEPGPKNPNSPPSIALWKVVCITLLVVAPVVYLALAFPNYRNSSAEVNAGGCQLRVMSLFERYESDPWVGPWSLKYRLYNAGDKQCLVHSDALDPKGIFAIDPGVQVERERLAVHSPKLLASDVELQAAGSKSEKVSVRIYREP